MMAMFVGVLRVIEENGFEAVEEFEEWLELSMEERELQLLG
jgi:hypothetical protein